MSKVEFEEYCVKMLKGSTVLFGDVESFFIEELVEAIFEKQANEDYDIKKVFEELREWYDVPLYNIIADAQIIYNLYNIYFKDEE